MKEERKERKNSFGKIAEKRKFLYPVLLHLLFCKISGNKEAEKHYKYKAWIFRSSLDGTHIYVSDEIKKTRHRIEISIYRHGAST